MKISEFFPSKYLKAADLGGKPVRCSMSHVEKVKMPDGKIKAALYFSNQERALLLNTVNANNIVAIYGEETDDWPGRPIVLFPAMVDFQGRSVDAIRVRAPSAKGAPQPNPPIQTTAPVQRRPLATFEPPPEEPADLEETF